MAKPTVEQVKAELEKLREIKPKVRHYTGFGDDNRAAIAAQIAVLVENMDDEEIYDRYEDSDHERDAAVQVRDWLDYGEEESPSESWAPLVQE